jgi:hypothetical protein
MDHLKDVVIIILRSNHKNKEEHFQSLYTDEFSKFPRLMTLACNEKDESKFMKQFNYFVQMKERISEKSISQHHADVEIGERLANIYLKNVNIK